MRPDLEDAIRLLERSDDPQALDQALALLQNTVFSFSMKVCGQRQDAEDTMQEVLVKSLAHLPKFSSPKALAVWLYKVAKNHCLMSRRRSKFAPAQELSLEQLMPDRTELERLAGSAEVNPETMAMRTEEARWLRQAVHKLPPPYRIVLVLRDMEGLTDQEVAEITGLRTGTVRVRLHRARLFVRNEVAKQQTRGIHAIASRGEKKIEPPRPASCKAMFAQLSDYLDEQLDDSLCDELEKHLGDCSPCQAFLATLQATIEKCRDLPPDHPDKKEAAELRHKLLAEYKSALRARAAQMR